MQALNSFDSLRPLIYCGGGFCAAFRLGAVLTAGSLMCHRFRAVAPNTITHFSWEVCGIKGYHPVSGLLQLAAITCNCKGISVKTQDQNKTTEVFAAVHFSVVSFKLLLFSPSVDERLPKRSNVLGHSFRENTLHSDICTHQVAPENAWHVRRCRNRLKTEVHESDTFEVCNQVSMLW